jgi:predicted regulator of Ras-like GTPase activity (Roadblock/LC7/MglB family)
MSELDDALAALEHAVRRLEAAPLLAGKEAVAHLTSGREAEDEKLAATAAEIVARVEAALDKLGQVLDAEG